MVISDNGLMDSGGDIIVTGVFHVLGTELMRETAQRRIQALGSGSSGLKQPHQPRAV